MTPPTPEAPYLRLLPVALLCALAVVLVRCAWLGDDAYISFRTIDNFIHGYGLRWNVAERVQTYTHPLWMFVLAAPIAITREFYFTPLVVSLVCTLAAAVLLFAQSRNSWAVAFGLALLLVSKSFTDYATSGLENPLSYLLVAVFVTLWGRPSQDRSQMLLLSLCAALLAVNRLDALLLVLPALGYRALRVGWKASMLPLALGFAPLILWELFALLYYGSLFPNTAYAKVFNNSLHWDELLKNGLYSYWASFRIDPITLLIIAIAAALSILPRVRRDLPIMLGVALYLLYTFRVGGDFMNGRFLSVPFFLSVCLLVRHLPPMNRAYLPLAVALVVASLFLPASPLRSAADYGHQAAWVARPHLFREHILDERGIYYPYTGLLKVMSGEGRPVLKWYEAGTEPSQRPRVFVAGRVGLPGFMGGPEAHIVDRLALTDPLLARLPARRPQGSSLESIGHYERFIPAGYLESLCHDENHLEDSAIAERFALIQSVTRAPLFSGQRLRDLVSLTFGRYNTRLNRSDWESGANIAVSPVMDCVPEHGKP